MNIETKYHGKMEIVEQQLITFESGIPGFIEEKRFVLLPFGEDAPFQILQSVNSQGLAFVVTSPFAFFADYAFDLPDQALEQLKIQSEKDVAVYVILTIHDPFNQSTANLQAPVVINPNKRLGKQVILTDAPFNRRQPLFTQQKAPAGQEG